MEYVAEVGRRERKRQAVHQSLLETAGELFEQRGIARTTIDDIVQAVDVARQTFFNHFPYKEAIALELGADGVREIALRAHAWLEAGTPAVEVLERLGTEVLETAISQGELAVVLARELLHSDPARAERAAEQIPLSRIFEAVLIQAREEGAIRADLPMDVVAARIGAVLTSITAQIMSVGHDQLRRELKVCLEMVLHGIEERRT